MKDVGINDATTILAYPGEDDSKLHINLKKTMIASRQSKSMSGIRNNFTSLSLPSDIYFLLDDPVLEDNLRNYATTLEEVGDKEYKVVEKDYYLIQNPAFELSKEENKILKDIKLNGQVVYLRENPLKLSIKDFDDSEKYYRVSRRNLDDIMALQNPYSMLKEGLRIVRQNGLEFKNISLKESLDKPSLIDEKVNLEYFFEIEPGMRLTEIPEEFRDLPMYELRLETFDDDGNPIWKKVDKLSYNHNKEAIKDTTNPYYTRLLFEITDDEMINKLSDLGLLQTYQTVRLPGKRHSMFLKSYIEMELELPKKNNL